jgi:DNA-binding XRE family transcriptional regulator
MKKRRTLAAQPNGLAHRIASVRKGLGLSQGAFGEAVGVSRNTVGRAGARGEAELRSGLR